MKKRVGYTIEELAVVCNIYEKQVLVNGKLIKAHRYIMEYILGRPLIKGEIVHHINGCHNDNRIENLALMTFKDHCLIHGRERSTRKFYASARWAANHYNEPIENHLNSCDEDVMYLNNHTNEEFMVFLFEKYNKKEVLPAANQ